MQAPPHAPDLLTRTALGVSRLNGQLLAVSERLARPAGLTTARRQVLGAVAGGPLPVAGIARVLGLTRQSVQRVADLVVAEGLAEYRPNPAHRRAKLLAPTDDGLSALRRITPEHAVFAAELAEHLGGTPDFRAAVEAVETLSRALDNLGY
ncbi:MarR family winged helix-turn-helix transcriptional regulator [Streptomyces monomycini]|uniref:MarR family winged helix-turn-helix transcriptional regulator n=1 Tax=Streptomyces monomycini TaxID=371720 RepID=UPI0004AB975F|nr:MarR family winged helix-turn-helix transcriptional regulator [Streptomyces monomycini]